MGRFSKARRKLDITVGYSKLATICCHTAVPSIGWALNFFLVGPEGKVQWRQVIFP